MGERQTKSGSSNPPTSADRASGECETLFRQFLETQAPEIVKSHGVPRRYAIIFGLVIVIATLANFGTSVFFGLDQSRNLGSQTGIQNLAERAAVAEVLSKAINSLNQAVTDLGTVSNALNQYSDGEFIFRGLKPDSWSVPRQNFVSKFCTSPATHTAQACLDGNIYALLRTPSLELTDGSQIQLAMTLELLMQIDDAVIHPPALGAPNSNSGNSIAGILKNARDTCESMTSGGAASQIEGPFTSEITPSAFAAVLTLSSAVNSTIRSARPLFESYLRIREDNNTASATAGRSNTDSSIENQVSGFKKSLGVLNKEVRNSADGTSSANSVQELSATIGLALTELKKKLPVILSDCEKRRSLFGERLTALTLKSSDLERLTKN